jgi:hypothetical protein
LEGEGEDDDALPSGGTSLDWGLKLSEKTIKECKKIKKRNPILFESIIYYEKDHYEEFFQKYEKEKIILNEINYAYGMLYGMYEINEIMKKERF